MGSNRPPPVSRRAAALIVAHGYALPKHTTHREAVMAGKKCKPKSKGKGGKRY